MTARRSQSCRVLLVSKEAWNVALRLCYHVLFKHRLKSLMEQLLIITPEFVCVILSHSRIFFVDCLGKRKQELDKQQAYTLSRSLAKNLTYSFSVWILEEAQACDRESYGCRKGMNILFFTQ